MPANDETVQSQLDKLTAIAAAALESIRGLERITARHDQQIARHDEQIDALLSLAERTERVTASHEERIAALAALAERTETSIRALADEIINTQREWRAYLRRIPPQ